MYRVSPTNIKGDKTTMLNILRWLVLVALACQALAQQPSRFETKPVPGEKRHLRMVTLTRWGFEPNSLTVPPGKITVVVRDLTGGSSAPVELRQNTQTGEVLETRSRPRRWSLTDPILLVLAPGDYFLGIPDSRSRSLRIQVRER